jgi:hypothetical protein
MTKSVMDIFCVMSKDILSNIFIYVEKIEKGLFTVNWLIKLSVEIGYAASRSL